MYEQIATKQVAADMAQKARIKMIVVPSARRVIDAHFFGAVTFLALLEHHPKAIKQQFGSEPAQA